MGLEQKQADRNTAKKMTTHMNQQHHILYVFFSPMMMAHPCVHYMATFLG